MRGVRFRLVVWNVLAIGLILASMALLLRAQLRQNAVLQVDNELRAEAESARVAGKSLGSGGMVLHLPVGATGSGKPEKGGQKLKSILAEDRPAEMITLQAQALVPKLIPVPLPANGDASFDPLDRDGYWQAAKGVHWAADFRLDGRPFRSNSLPIVVHGRVAAVVQAARSMEPTEAMLRRFDAALLPLLPVALLVSAFAGTILVAGTMRPLRILTDSARALTKDERLPIVGQDEFADLAIAFNVAYDRTSQALRQLERFTGDAGHELRAPLAVIKGSVSRMLSEEQLPPDERAALEIVDRAANRMTRLIADLLLLARQDSGAVISFQPICLKALVESALESLPPNDRCAVTVSVDPGLTVLGDPVMLERAVANLAANALAYARTKISVEAITNGKQVEITISDDGEGIAAEHLARLGERFYRPEASRSREQGGVGLGLAITRGIIEAHGGTLEIRSEIGVGTTVFVRMAETK